VSANKSASRSIATFTDEDGRKHWTAPDSAAASASSRRKPETVKSEESEQDPEPAS
jgi:hypothetical protein